MGGGAARVACVSRRAAVVEQEYWMRMLNAINEKGSRVWGVLEKQLEKYKGLVQVQHDKI
jgi:hypothetical protein